MQWLRDILFLLGTISVGYGLWRLDPSICAVIMGAFAVVIAVLWWQADDIKKGEE
jgi:hypothetical protein